MSEDTRAVSGRRATAGVSLPTPVQAKQWEEVAPGTFALIFAEITCEQRHRRRLEWAEQISRVFGQVCAFSTVVILTLLARHFADHGAATQGATVIGTGAVSIVAVFLTGRLARRS